MAISSPGIGSNLDINSIVSQLMQVESQPLTTLAKKEASYQAQLSAFGSLSSALSTFQATVAGLTNPAKFQSVSANSSDSTVFSASATSQASPGTYNINVSRLAQAQSLLSAGIASSTAAIGDGTATTLTFQFGTINDGAFASAGVNLGNATVTNGIAANSLTINGTTIATSSLTKSAMDLASQINLAKDTTGVTATANAADTGTADTGSLGALGVFTTITPGAGNYSLNVGGVSIIANSTAALTATDIDNAITAAAANLAAAGITVSGQVAGTGASALRFSKADGSNLAITETLAGGTTGGFMSSLAGGTKTYTGSVSLSSLSSVSIGGNNPAAAGFTAGPLTKGVYSGASFAQDAGQAAGTLTISSSNNTLQGIRDAINNANLGVTATIVSDGSSKPYHLALTSNKTGANSSLKITATGGDGAVASLLNYDPAGVQNMAQTSAAQDAMATVNGIAVSGSGNTLTDTIQGVTLNLAKTGASTLTIARDTNAIQTSVSNFVKSYNDLNKALSGFIAYDADSKQGGILLGDSMVPSIQSQIRNTLGAVNSGLTGSLTTLSQIGVSFQKDGTLSLDSSKLQKAVSSNFSDIASLFATVGKTTDGQLSFASSTSATKPGTYNINITALATQGMLSGTVDLNAAPTVIASGTNVNATVDGVTANVTLTAGSYTASEFAAMLQSAINGASAISSAGSAVTVSVDSSGHLNIQSKRYGSASNVSISNGSGTTVDTFAGNTPGSTAGVDVAGTINGIAALGSGQNLTGASGTDVEGLKILVSGGALGARGTVSLSQGYADKLNKVIDGYIGSSGIISGRTTGLNNTIKDIGRTRDDLNNRLADIEKRYRAQFTALDTMISSMTKTSSFLTQQLANLPKTQ